MPKEVRVAALWKRTGAEDQDLDYCVHETEQWVVLPYELAGLTREEIEANKPDLIPLFS
jgi:hypothetical protein